MGRYLRIAQIVKARKNKGRLVVRPVDGLPFLLYEGLELRIVPPTPEIPCTVTVEDAKGNEMTCRIVGSQEADPMHKVFSEESPFGKALIGAQEGDEVTVEAPMGALVYRVKKIER